MGCKCHAEISCSMEPMETVIQSYDKIVLIPYGMKNFHYEIPIMDRKVLLILTEPYETMDKNLTVGVISKAEADELLRFYNTYEFTNNFFVLTENKACYASIFNFVRAGILSPREAWQAMLL